MPDMQIFSIAVRLRWKPPSHHDLTGGGADSRRPVNRSRQALFFQPFRFLDVEFEVVSDTPEIVGLFRAALSRLAVDRPLQRPLRFVVLADPLKRGIPVMDLDGSSFEVHRSDLLPGIAYMKVMQEVYRRVRSHLLVHGAAVCRDGAGIVFPASSSVGKTTLAVRLVMEGWGFLSDDLAAVDVETGEMAPLPRSLGIRWGTLSKLGLEGIVEVGRLPYVSGGEKRLFDVDSIRLDAVPAGCRFTRLILLTPPGPDEPVEQPEGAAALSIVVDRVEPAFLEALRGLPGVEGVDVEEGHLVELTVEHESAPLAANLEGLAEAHHVMIFDRGPAKGPEKSPEGSPDPRFDGTPTIDTVGTIDAARELAKSFLGGPRSGLLQDRFGGSAASMIFGIAGLLEGVPCHRMTVGDLDEMVRLVYNLR